MKLKFIIILYFFVSTIFCLHSESSSTPTPYVNSVNVITGRTLDSTSPQFELYVEGRNDVGGITVQVPQGDFRIGRVKLQKNSNQLAVRFFYYPGYTEIFDPLNHKSLYRYSKDNLLESVEHFTTVSNDSYALYRKERFFWDPSFSPPRLISRYIEDAQGQVHGGYLLKYNEQGLITKETIVGNLSGTSQTPILIQDNGLPENSDCESYSVSNEYDREDPSLLVKEREDNGSHTSYGYHPKTKQCISKLKGDKGGIVSRCFYFYDDNGFLSRTILDDGKGSECKDLTGVTSRQIIENQFCQDGPAVGQPLVTESKYLNLESSEEVLLEKVVCTYSSKGELVQKDYYDANGAFRYYIHLNYDSKGSLESTVDSRGETVTDSKEAGTSRYNQYQQCEALIDTNGNETTYQYDDFGRNIQTTYPSVLDDKECSHHPLLINEYDIQDHIIQTKDANGRTTNTSYNMRGKPTLITYPDGSTESYVYFLDGNLKESIDKYGCKKTFARDSFGRVTESKEYSSKGNLINTILHTYKGAFLESVTDSKTFTIKYSYDGAGREIGTRHETQDGVRRKEWAYDASGQKTVAKEWFGSHEQDFVSKIEEKNAWQETTGIRIESANGDVQRKIANQTKNNFIFSQEQSIKNKQDQHVRQQETVDAFGMREITIYDALKRPENITIMNPFGDKISEKQIRYDDNGNKTLERHFSLVGGKPVRSYTISWTYDHADHLTSIQEEGGTLYKKTCYQYNPQGLLEAIIKPDGKILNYVYDETGRPTRFTANDHSFDYQYTYDDSGRLSRIEDLINAYSIHRQYNAFNDITEESFSNIFAFKNEYDLAGRRTSLTLPDNSQVLYQYRGSLLESIQRLDAQQNRVYQHSYQYQQETGKLAASHLIGDLGAISYSYDKEGRIAAIQSPWWSESIPKEGFDQYNNLSHMTIQDPAGKTEHHYNYSSDHQIQSEEGYFNHQYQYDSLNNRIAYNGENWTVNSLNQLVKAADAEYDYDANGNMTNKKCGESIIHYEYDALNRLIRVTKGNEKAIQYIYDPFNRRLAEITFDWDAENNDWKQSEVNNFLFDGEKEIGKADAKGKIVELRILGLGKGAEIGTAVAFEIQNKIYAPVHDHQGSVRCLVDIQNKSVAEFYRYSAYGVEEIYEGQGTPLQESQIGNPWRFSSKRRDAYTKLIFFGNRYYDPTIGRWLTPDPLFFHDSPNLYAYVKNNPLTNYDLYGLFSISSIWDAAVQAFYNGCVYLIKASYKVNSMIMAELKIPNEIAESFQKIAKKFLGEGMMTFLGYHEHHPTESGTYGKGEIHEKVRVTFINGILTGKNLITENVDLISKSHGGVNVHYIFRSTEGWTWDIGKALLIKFGFQAGFRSEQAHLLSHMWKELIQDMGGVNGGGVIIHYAHSLGGSDTDRARELMTPEEQKMIRVITFGSSTLVRNVGFQSVINYISVCDGVSCFLIEPLGHLRNIFDQNSNVVWLGHFFSWPIFPLDHPLSWKTYRSVLSDYGDRFLLEFAPR